MNDLLVVLLGEATLILFDIIGAYIFIFLYFRLYQKIKLSLKQQLLVVAIWIIGHVIIRLIF
ncbi:hypothetical protein YSY22_47720 [Brevibacillus formosus]